MLTRHANELYRRLERVADVGVAEIRKPELLLWNGQERVTVNIWRDLHDKWQEVGDNSPLLVGDAEGVWVLAYGDGLTASSGSWFKDVRELAKRKVLADA